jgi:peptidoglycan DL-endopeptidase CwlO
VLQVPQSRRARRRTLSEPAGSRRKTLRRATVLGGAAALCAALLPSGIAAATSGAPAAPAGHAASPSSLKAVLAEANALSEQIDSLGQQYDNLRIQLTQARANAKAATEEAARDEQLLGSAKGSVDAIAVENYMSDGMNPSLELLATSSPQSLLNRASIMTEIEQENGDKLTVVAAAETTAQRAQEAAVQEQQHAKSLSKEMAVKVDAIESKENFFNGQAFQKAQAIFDATGKYPDIHVHGDSIGVQALRWALTRLGDEYVWGGAGPDDFDCSGLVMWAYAQIGISLEHFTGDQWNEVVHVPRSELEPGDLVFFYPGIEHVGLYMGDGMMVDAPTFGQPVQVQPMMWNVYDGGGYVPA